MDPNATLELIVESALEGNAEALHEATRDLVAWLEGGGFASGPKAAHIAALRAGYNPL